MSKFVEIFKDLVINALNQVYRFGVQLAPKIVFSLIILLIGWVCALLLKKIASKLLKALGLDVLSEKIGFVRFLERGGIKKPSSSIIGIVFYWIIIFSALIMVFNTLELEVASQLIKQALLYIPKIAVALILIALGIFLSQFMGKFVQASARLVNISFYATLGKMARYIIIGLAIMVALEYLGVATTVIMQYAVIVFIVVPLIVSLIFAIAGKDILSSILAGRLLIKEYKIGDMIEFDSISGQIESIDFITTKINTDKGELIVPNSELVKKIIKKVKAGENRKVLS